MSKKYEFLQIPIEKLDADNSNPRLPKSFLGKTDEEIINYLLLESSLVELMQAIGENDFFPGEQLLVVEGKNGHYTVIEGNRRLTAVLLLNDPTLAKVHTKKVIKVYDDANFHPKTIPCLVFPTRDEILKYLGYRHITGIQTWKLLEKARYLSELKKQIAPTDTIVKASRDLAKMIGSRADYVRRLLVGYVIYKFIEDQGFYGIPNLNDTTFHFNYIADSLAQSNITKFLGIDFNLEEPTKTQNNKHLEEWTKWFFEKNPQNQTRLKGTSGDLTKLNQILGDEDALKHFRNGESLTQAHQFTDDVNNLFYSFIKKSLESLEEANKISHYVDSYFDDSKDCLNIIGKLSRKLTLEIVDEQ